MQELAVLFIFNAFLNSLNFKIFRRNFWKFDKNSLSF